MKFLLNHYRTLIILLSIVVLAMSFAAGSDREGRGIWVTMAFLAGACMYSIGGVREWMLGRRIGSMVEILLAVCMWTALAFVLLQPGGIL